MKNKVIKKVFAKNDKSNPKDPSIIFFMKHRKKDSLVRKVLNVLTATYYEYADRTKVNGMFYLRKFSSGGCQRMLWSCIMIFLLSFSATLVHLLYRRYLDSPTRVTIAPPMPINTIPFPAVTICHPQNVMEYKSKAFVKRIKLPLGVTEEKLIQILPLLAGFTEHQWTYPRIEDLEMIDKVLDLNKISVDDAMMQIGTVCSDFLLVCYFDRKKFPCFQKNKFITFVESYSYLGACCSFNYKPESKYGEDFFAVNSFGVNEGLSVVGTGRPQASDGKSGAIYSKGFVAIVHHTNDFAVESAPSTFLELAKETFIYIQPIHSSCSDQVLALPLQQRKCIVPSDLNAATYRQPACMLGCLRDEIYKRCRCHPFHLPRADNQTNNNRDCRAKDIYCFAENSFEFKTVHCEYCFPSCSDVVYKTNSFEASFHRFNCSINPFYYETNLTNEEFIVRAFYGRQTVRANKKIVVMSWISLLSNLGGSFSLCLGISVLSVIEIFFFLSCRTYRHYKTIFQVEPVIPKVFQGRTRH